VVLAVPLHQRTLADGWLHRTSRRDGYLYLTDRAKDVIITGSSNVYPREVEEVLLTHPQVREVDVIGVPDCEWGESVCGTRTWLFLLDRSGQRARGLPVSFTHRRDLLRDK